MIWDSNDLVVNRCVLQMILVVCWFELQVMLVVNWFEIQMFRLSIDARFKWFWLSVDLNFKWCGCQLIWDSSDLDVKWFEVQVIWLSTDVWFKWFCQTKLFCETSFKIEALKLKNEAFLRDFLQKRSFEDHLWNFSARLPSKISSFETQMKHFCETSFKNETLKLKNEAFLRDVLQNWTFEAQKRSFSARLPSKTKLRNWQTKLLYETFFKNDALKIKNEAFLRDFLQKRSFEDHTVRLIGCPLSSCLNTESVMLSFVANSSRSFLKDTFHQASEGLHGQLAGLHGNASYLGHTFVTHPPIRPVSLYSPDKCLQLHISAPVSQPAQKAPKI